MRLNINSLLGVDWSWKRHLRW